MSITKFKEPRVTLTTVEKRIDQEARRLLAGESGRLFRLASGQLPDEPEDQRNYARFMIRMVMIDPNSTAMTRLVIARASEISMGLSECPALRRRMSNRAG
ncbi:MAG: hypothetical protein K9G48_01955 [Reyranella sp.]|nr:hypothetical protein [Reyranella sp.]